MTSAVILIIAHKANPIRSEIASLKQCFKVLGNYPITLVCPTGMDVTAYKDAAPSLRIDYMDPRWFSSYAMFNRLKISPLLYRNYRKFEYILFYELDAWVFRDELEFWCSKGYDYIGSPWFEGFYKGKSDAKFLGVGNGGFSLRKTKSHLKALRSWHYIVSFKALWEQFVTHPRPRTLINFLKNITVQNNVFFLFNRFDGNEDLFWGLIVAKRFKWFKTPDPVTASHFSMEFNAPLLFDANAGKLPFGCHKWEALNPEFWKRFIQT